MGRGPSARRARDELLELVGLDPDVFAKRYPSQLSGGQQQRVGVARALAADPPVLLMDEPFAAVDPIARGRLQDEFLRLQAEVRKTIVFVTHDLDEAVRLGDRIAVFSVGGVLEQYDAPAAVLGSPATPFVADFVGGDRALARPVGHPGTARARSRPVPPGFGGAVLPLRSSLREALVASAGLRRRLRHRRDEFADEAGARSVGTTSARRRPEVGDDAAVRRGACSRM